MKVNVGKWNMGGVSKEMHKNCIKNLKEKTIFKA
jgi:hypothetical protein